MRRSCCRQGAGQARQAAVRAGQKSQGRRRGRVQPCVQSRLPPSPRMPCLCARASNSPRKHAPGEELLPPAAQRAQRGRGVLRRWQRQRQALVGMQAARPGERGAPRDGSSARSRRAGGLQRTAGTLGAGSGVRVGRAVYLQPADEQILGQLMCQGLAPEGGHGCGVGHLHGGARGRQGAAGSIQRVGRGRAGDVRRRWRTAAPAPAALAGGGSALLMQRPHAAQACGEQGRLTQARGAAPSVCLRSGQSLRRGSTGGHSGEGRGAGRRRATPPPATWPSWTPRRRCLQAIWRC